MVAQHREESLLITAGVVAVPLFVPVELTSIPRAHEAACLPTHRKGACLWLGAVDTYTNGIGTGHFRHDVRRAWAKAKTSP